jgi:hypothetical protein
MRTRSYRKSIQPCRSAIILNTRRRIKDHYLVGEQISLFCALEPRVKELEGGNVRFADVL